MTAKTQQHFVRNRNQDMEFARHAANAYPHNIALLKKIMHIYTNAASGAIFAEKFPALEVRALLRELGEDA